jgi:FKBP-type peptidyl-prolyl cis-trans isomerase FklB
MNTKTFILILSVVTLAFTSCCSYSQTSTSLKNDTDTASFYIGYSFGMQLKNMGITQPNISAIVAGLNTAFRGKEAPVDQQTLGMFLNKYVDKMLKEKAEKAVTDGKEFFEKNGKKAGVVTTESGLQYKIETEGTGATPTDTSTVRVHYSGKLLDGTEFDSSIKRGQPAEFRVAGVIPGWTEALKLMPVGSKWTIYIPSELGYGAQGQPYGGIGANETLIFEVELLDILNPNAGEEEEEHNHEH